jgi:hypothetical protein
MKHHYIVRAVIRQNGQEFLCPLGAVCQEEELGNELKRHDVMRYKIKSVDDEHVADWENTEWIPV